MFGSLALRTHESQRSTIKFQVSALPIMMYHVHADYSVNCNWWWSKLLVVCGHTFLYSITDWIFQITLPLLLPILPLILLCGHFTNSYSLQNLINIRIKTNNTIPPIQHILIYLLNSILLQLQLWLTLGQRDLRIHCRSKFVRLHLFTTNPLQTPSF